MADFNFVDHSKVPDRIWNSEEGNSIRETLTKFKASLGVGLERVELFPNVGHVYFGTNKVLNGVVYYVRRGTPVANILSFIGPLYQHMSVFDLGSVSDQKIAECKDKWNEIIDPADAQGSGLPGHGIDVHDSVDLVDEYRRRDKISKSWYTSLGTYYPGFAILGKDKLGKTKLVISGGHKQLHKKMAVSILERTNVKIEDIADRVMGLDADKPLLSVINNMKDVQIINHSKIASKVSSALGLNKFGSDPYDNFSAPIPVNYSCFYNTVHAAINQRGGNAQTFAITQGVLDTTIDLQDRNPGETVNLYMIENPKKVHQIAVYKNHIEKIRYFPVTTGSSTVCNLGMTEKDKIEIRNNTHCTGVSSVNNITDVSFQPYDHILRTHTNDLFGGNGYAMIASDHPLDGVVYSITGYDPRNLELSDYLKYTQHLPDDASVKAPSNSAPVNLIFKTYPKVLDVLGHQGGTNLPLFNVIQNDERSAHFVQFQLGSLRLAQKIQDSSNADDSAKLLSNWE